MIEKDVSFEPVITDSAGAPRELEKSGILYEGEIDLKKIGFCKLEAQQNCLTGSFCIPWFLDVQGARYCILFFITRDKIVLVDDEGFSERMTERIRQRKGNENMPELENGYYGVIILSVIVVIACIIIFKIKKIF